jgi:3-phenylpropionate/cinnamic acid dioxygenase small subunit
MIAAVVRAFPARVLAATCQAPAIDRERKLTHPHSGAATGIQELADRQAINDLLIDYCLALDRMDLEAITSLFTADCEVDFGPEKPLQSSGSEALARSLQRLWRWARTSHHLSNVRIRLVDDNHARAVSYVIAWHERPDGTSATVFGQYHDRLLRTPDGWRIAHRRMFMNGSDAAFTVNINPFERNPAPPGWVAPKIDR